MNQETAYDVAIAGGGLAGLSSAILLAEMGFKTILFEKESYPFHKVCGEYISMESYDFLQRLGVALDEMHLPKISQLQLTAPNGKIFETTLPLGGFGISRYTLDHRLAQLARASGVVVMENTKVESISFQ